jgi:protein SCO1/2
MAGNTPEPKTPRALWAMLVFVALLLGAGAIGLGALVSEQSGAKSSGGIGGPFRLQTGGGKSGPVETVTDADLRGAPFLVFFGYTHCPDVCPTTLFQLSEILRALGSEAKIKALFVTVDPERDTPELMKDYAGSFDPRIIGLSGDRAAIDKVMAEYRVYARKAPGEGKEYTMDHSAVIYLMDRDGKFLRAFNLERKPEQAAAELKPLL